MYVDLVLPFDFKLTVLDNLQEIGKVILYRRAFLYAFETLSVTF